MLDVPLAACLTMECGFGPARIRCGSADITPRAWSSPRRDQKAPSRRRAAGARRHRDRQGRADRAGCNPRVAAHAFAGLAIIFVIIVVAHPGLRRLCASFADTYAGTLSWRRSRPQFPPGAAIAPHALLTLAGVLPWAALAVRASGPLARAALAAAAGSSGVAVAWVIAFFGLSTGKIIIRYMLPAVPAIAALIGRYLCRPRQRGCTARRSRRS
jgi:hypothetical protein